jgi:hypothetical protein
VVHGLLVDGHFDFGEGDLYGYDDVDYDQSGLEVFYGVPNVGVGRDDCPHNPRMNHGLVDDHYDLAEGDLHAHDDVDYDEPGLHVFADVGHDDCPHDVVHRQVDDQNHYHVDFDEPAWSADVIGHDELYDAV